MNPRAELGHPYGDVFRDPAGALHGFAKTATLGARCAAIITIFSALLTGCRSIPGSGSGSGSGAPTASTGCGGGSGAPALTYQPILLPIEISLALDGSIEVSFSPELVTPLGTFSLSVPVACWKIHSNDTLLVIRRLVHGAMKKDIIKINDAYKLAFLLDGPADLTSEGNIATLSLRNGVTGIRIKGAESGQAEPYSKRQVSTLPTPAGMTAPAAPPASWPSPRAACKTAGSDGMVICTATVTGGTGNYAYQWFDPGWAGGRPIGTDNSLRTILAAGDHLITVTATVSNDSFFTSVTSCAVTVTVAGGQASTKASAC